MYVLMSEFHSISLIMIEIRRDVPLLRYVIWRSFVLMSSMVAGISQIEVATYYIVPSLKPRFNEI